MHDIQHIPVVPVIRAHVRLPLRALLVVPNDKSLSDAHIFNVPGAINHLMGSASWETASRVMEPKIFAPHWTDERLTELISRPFPEKERPFPHEAISVLREESFPPFGTGPVDLNTTSSPFEIIHAVGNFGLAGKTPEPLFRLKFERATVQDDDFAAGRVLPAGRLRDLLVALRTRLLILQVVRFSAANAVKLARYVVGAGGPATLVVSGGSPAGLDRYFLDLYAEIIHNQTLGRASKPDGDEGSPDVTLILGENGESALQFTPWFNDLSNLIDRVDDPFGYGKMLHAEQKEQVLNRLSMRASRPYFGVYDENNLPMYEAEGPTLRFQLSELKELRNNIDSAHERGGVLPLSEIAEAATQLEAIDAALDRSARDRGRGDGLHDEVLEFVKNAPRVLNANFADSVERRVLGPHEPLSPQTEYDLLVDVGPRWSDIPSLVTGNDTFPEQALPQDAGGHRVEVVFFSDDFQSVEPQHEPGSSSVPDAAPQTGAFATVEIPPLPDNPFATPFSGAFRRPAASAAIWMPAGGGRSFPIVSDDRANKPGPVRLRVRTSSGPGPAYGRLSLYYAGNLLQSAAVRVTIAGAGQMYAPVPNTIAVDYVLSGGFRDLGSWETRALTEEGEAYRVGVNLALNGDGSGAHRLMIAGRDDLTVARPYDPAASESLLQTARSKLKECFSLRNDACIVTEPEAKRKPALDARNGKSLKEFKCDLFQLAWYGADLYTQAFGQLSSSQLVRYLRDLAAALKSRTVIQVARTAQAQYVYPWAMIYDIPLPNRHIQRKLKWCKVIEEWGKGPNSNRAVPVEKECPFHEEPEHQQDMLCPYGIWGLKHYIEQPINVTANGAAEALTTADAPNTVTLGKPVAFGLGVTRDAALDQESLKKHVTKIATLAPCTPADGADDWDDVQNMLAAPDIAYFLCHGEYDAVEKKPFLGIGPRGNDPLNRVYPDQLLQWARTRSDAWALTSRRPLVFINGCHTADLKPGEVLSFVTTFANLGASGVIGTEISIRLPLATEMAEKLLERLLKGETVGAAMHALRWELANKGNLLGLAYTPYCRSDLAFTSSS